MDRKATFRLRSAAGKGASLPDTAAHKGEDLSHWLQEAGKRPWVNGPLSLTPLLPATGHKMRRAPQARRHLQHGRDLVGLAILTIGFLQYYYLDVMVPIDSLQKVVVFVPVTVA